MIMLAGLEKGARSGRPSALAPYALAPGGDSGAVPTAVAIRAGKQSGHIKWTPVLRIGCYSAALHRHFQWRR
jgi:hypothetical protein